MNLYKEIYNFIKEARPRTKNIGVEDIDRPGSGKVGRDTDADTDSATVPTYTKYEVTVIKDGGTKKETELTPSDILKFIRTNPENKNIDFQDVKVGEKYDYVIKTPLGKEKKGSVILKNKNPIKVPIVTDRKSTPPININPTGQKSSYQKGAVHEIIFNNITKGISRKPYTIYRNISEIDYQTLKFKNPKKVQTVITPSTEKNHFKDVYYITIPKVLYSLRKGADYTYFIYLPKSAVDSYTNQQKEKIKLTLVPIEDIAKGLDKRPLDFFTFSSFLSDKEKEKLRSPRSPKSTEKEEPVDFDLSLLFGDDLEKEKEEPKDTPEQKEAKKKAAEFMLDDKNQRAFTALLKNYDILKTPSSTQSEKSEADKKMSEYLKRFLENLFNYSKDPKVTDSVINYSVESRLKQKQGLYKLIKNGYDQMKSLQEKMILEMNTKLSDDSVYDVDIKYASGSKPQSVKAKGAAVKKLIGTDTIEYNKEYDFEKVVDDPQRGMQKIKGTLKVNMDPKSRNLKLVGRRTLSGEPIEGDPSTKKDDTKEKPDTKTFNTSISGQGSRSYKVPINKGVKMATVKPNQLRYKYYVVNNKTKQFADGSDDWKETKEKAKKLGPDFIALSKAALSSYGVEIYENKKQSSIKKEDLSKEDKASLESKAISFTIQSDPKDLDAQAEVKGIAKKATLNKEKNELTIVLDNNSQVIFTKTKSGNITGVYNSDPSDRLGAPNKVNDIKEPLKSVLDKIFPSPADAKLEAYIRTRIRQALKEAGIDQYFGTQGPDVKKKRLKEYMMKYEWGFQKSEDPFIRKTGSEKHAIVTKLVNELGDEGVAIFNSYAPEGMEIASPNDLDNMADTPLGSQLHQPYDPNSLTARGGRIAEMDGPVPYRGQGADQLNRLVKDMPSKLKTDIKAKVNAEQAKHLIAVFKSIYKISNDVSDEDIYNKIKNA